MFVQTLKRMTPRQLWLLGIIGVVLLVVVLTLLIRGCMDEQPAETEVTPPIILPPAAASDEVPYADYLAGVRICLDPGHGGRADRPNWKRGPTGLREAEVNLRVALFLQEMLEANGAIVFMTRTEDVYLHRDDNEDLRLRAQVANDNNVDLFVSIHHNAGSRPAANFTTVWYHGGIDDYTASVDIARYLSIALIDELDLPQVIGVPVLSDYLMYPGTGFAVLRQTAMPAVLCESSFHTNPDEEQRLRDPQYNRREARAIFTGLARYAYAGLPRAEVVTPADGRVSLSSDRQVTLQLIDGLSQRKSWGWERKLILDNTIDIRLKDRRLDHDFDENSETVTFQLPANLSPGTVTLNVQFQNFLKQSNIRPRVDLEVVR